MFRAVRVINLTSAFVLAATFAIGAEKADKPGEPASRARLPRYQLTVGQQLDYEASSTHKHDRGEMRSATEWRFLIVAANADGSWRVLVSKTMWHGSGANPISKDADRARPVLAYFDLHADGRIVGNSSLGFQTDVREIFPRLPEGLQEGKAGWTDKGILEGTHHYQMKPGDAGQVRISDTEASPLREVYLLKGEANYDFDPSRGIIDRVEKATSQGWGIRGEATEEIKLTSSETQGRESIAKLAAEIPIYFDAADDYRKRIDQAESDAGRSEELCAKAKERLEHAAAKLTAPMLKTQAEKLLANHEMSAKYAVQAAERQAKVVGKEAADFETTDLDGRAYSLTDFRGNVAVLDFWYRGCGWCIRAMPQINEVARTFKGRPVVVLGMNTDREIDDAKFVVQKMGLVYTNLKADGLPEKFQVRGFPTLIVLDQKGIVRHFHVGYSPTLAAELIEKIDALLAE